MKSLEVTILTVNAIVWFVKTGISWKPIMEEDEFYEFARHLFLGLLSIVGILVGAR